MLANFSFEGCRNEQVFRKRLITVSPISRYSVHSPAWVGLICTGGLSAIFLEHAVFKVKPSLSC
jgi:hypothetical protein